MSLNIKNERVHDLAREAAQRTGQSQTRVIEVALLEYLAHLKVDLVDRRNRIDALLGEIDHRLSDSDRDSLSTDDLYDEIGLPR